MLLRVPVARHPGRALLALTAFVRCHRADRFDLLLVTAGAAQAQPAAPA